MKRDWSKINFWMSWFALFLLIFVISTVLLIKLEKQQDYNLEYGCAVKGLNVYNKNGVECINDDGQLYDTPIQYISTGWFSLTLLFFIASLSCCIYSFTIVYDEYKRGE